MTTFDLRAALARWADHDREEAAVAARFSDLVAQPRCYWRDCFPAHFTASAWLVSGDGARVLLMHHRKLDRWLQPGGHADGDTDLPRVAWREAKEETGLNDLVGHDELFDLDAHEIPPRGHEPVHWHFDVRFVVTAKDSEIFAANHESRAMAWRDIAEVAADADIDTSIRRMARRWMSR